MRVMRSAGLLLLLCACRFHFDPLGAGDDDSDGGDTMGGDGGAELGAFSPPVQVTALSTARSDQGPSLTADLRELYFYSNRSCPSCYDLFVTTRATVTDPWGTPAEIMELTAAGFDMSPEVAPDGLTLWYSSERESPAGGADIWVTTRPNRTSPWNPPMRELNLSTAGYDTDPGLSEDGLTMTLTSDGSGAAFGDIWISKRTSIGAPWSVPVPVAELNTAVLESAGSLRNSGNTMFFAREVTKFDIYVSTRDGAAFGPGVVLANVNSSQLDFDAWVSQDMRTLFFASDRTGNMEIFEATR
jgi:hypothetical protein